MNPEEFLDLARRCVVSLSVKDAAAQLGEANSAFGLAKIMWAQVQAGLEPCAAFIAAPDATITRNASRWRAGFGYGGKVVYEFDEPTVVLDLKPNACGMLVGAVEELPRSEELMSRLEALTARPGKLQGVELQWDFTAGNHFIDLFAARSLRADFEIGRYVFIIHTSVPELRGPSALGVGLYWDRSPELLAQADEVATPWGPLHLLRGRPALAYYEFFRAAANFAAAKRLRAAECLFGDFQLLSNHFHQGLLAVGEVLLGSHSSLWPQPLPLTLRPDLPAYLVRGRPNLSAELVERDGLATSAPGYVAQWLTVANLVPHGGGYALEGIRRLRRAWCSGQRCFFELEREAADAPDLITDPTNMPVCYRGRQVLLRSLEYGLGEVLARLDPLVVIKA
jgi:hypothetical protein